MFDRLLELIVRMRGIEIIVEGKSEQEEKASLSKKRNGKEVRQKRNERGRKTERVGNLAESLDVQERGFA
jgi:hypothetical protein